MTRQDGPVAGKGGGSVMDRLLFMIYVAYYYITVNEFHTVFHIWLFL